MRGDYFSWVFCGVVAMAGSVLAGEGDAKAGQVKSQLCQSCHGVNGISTDPTIPKLAGQFMEYMYKQLGDFQIRNREDARMSPMAATLTNRQDMMDITAYFAAQTQMRGLPAKVSQAQLGKNIFENGLPERGLAACAGCHGVQGKGKSKDNPQFPVIGGQHKQYLLKQLNDFKAGKRQTDPTEIMANIAKILNKDELDAVAEYVASL